MKKNLNGINNNSIIYENLNYEELIADIKMDENSMKEGILAMLLCQKMKIIQKNSPINKKQCEKENIFFVNDAENIPIYNFLKKMNYEVISKDQIKDHKENYSEGEYIINCKVGHLEKKFKALRINDLCINRNIYSIMVSKDENNYCLYVKGEFFDLIEKLDLNENDKDFLKEKFIEYENKGCKLIFYAKKNFNKIELNDYLSKLNSIGKNSFEKRKEIYDEIENKLELLMTISLKIDYKNLKSIEDFIINEKNLKIFFVSSEDFLTTKIMMNSCNIIKNSTAIVNFDEMSIEEIKFNINQSFIKLGKNIEDWGKTEKLILFIEGITLELIYSNIKVLNDFILLSFASFQVIGYNMNSEQKALLVKILKRNNNVCGIGSVYHDKQMLKNSNFSVEILPFNKKNWQNVGNIGMKNFESFLKILLQKNLNFGKFLNKFIDKILFFCVFATIQNFFFSFENNFQNFDVYLGVEYTCIFIFYNIAICLLSFIVYKFDSYIHCNYFVNFYFDYFFFGYFISIFVFVLSFFLFQKSVSIFGNYPSYELILSFNITFIQLIQMIKVLIIF